MNVLITGGAGFIGSRLARRLVADGCSVTVLDNFSPQVHGEARELPGDLASAVRLIVGDVRDADAMTDALVGQEVVVHLAAETGTGQSMYEVRRYEDVNIGGTAVLFDGIVNQTPRTVRKVVVASSRAVYGEGAYRCAAHGVVFPTARTADDMRAGRFEPVCPTCGSACESTPTPESARTEPSSFYGLTKLTQEQTTLLFARALGIAGFALRYQNVYGPGQSLRNPYTGILAIFSNLARANAPIQIFEDGRESRDFVYIDDVVEATRRCVQEEAVGVHALNIGGGHRTAVREVADEIVAYYGSASSVSVTGAFRLGDVRHNVADLALARQVLGYEPTWSFRDGLREFLAWASAQDAASSDYEASLKEMADKGLLHG
jgi:dTDP-L-rhamnose 4-epimerase